MDDKKKELLETAMQLELNVCDLYLMYRETFPEDKEFWEQMAKEEKHHAALLDLADDFFDQFPKELIYNNLNELQAVNKTIRETIERYKQQPPSRKEAYTYAIQLEESAYELHYQKLLTEKTSTKARQTFQKLNEDDKNHAQRIRKVLPL